jgi:hypothetical protein
MNLMNYSFPTIFHLFPMIFKYFRDPFKFFPDPLNFSCANSMFSWQKHHFRVVPALQYMAIQDDNFRGSGKILRG